MPLYARRSITANANRTTRPRRYTKRRGNGMAKMRYGRQNARAQQNYILRNARLVNKLNAHYKASKVYCDWKYDLPNQDSGVVSTGNWAIWPLTDFDPYLQVMRQNITVLAANHTFISRMSISCQAALSSLPSLFFNCFLVRPRYQSANRVFAPPLINGLDYIENSNNPGEMLQLNPSVFKVIAKKQFRLFTNNPEFEQDPGSPPTQTVGDISHCVRRWVWNYDCKIKVSAPSAGNWKSVQYETLPYYNKIFMLVYVQPADQTAGDAVPFTVMAKLTTINVE